MKTHSSIQTFVRNLSEHLRQDPDSIPFDDLARQAFALQFQGLEGYRRLCESRGITPSDLSRWQDIPAVPVAAFKTLKLHLASPREIFRSSGTTGGRRSVHYHPFPDLYRQVIDATFPTYCLSPPLSSQPETAGGTPLLALVPPRSSTMDSSLGFMIDHVLQRFGGEDSHYAFGPSGVDIQQADGWCRRRQDDGRPGLILATSFALAQWLEQLNAEGRRWRLPPGSAIFDTGGFKGHHRQLRPEDLARYGELCLGIEPRRWVREYGMTELTSQFYTRSLLGGDADTFVGPPWLRPQILDPHTLRPVEDNQPGLLSLIDLANAGSVLHVLTQDLGIRHGEGFRLIGRASGAELRGCSLTVEELVS